MDGGPAILRPFNSISVISGRCMDDNERLCAMELRLRLRRFLSNEDRTRSARPGGQRLTHRATGAPIRCMEILSRVSTTASNP